MTDYCQVERHGEALEHYLFLVPHLIQPSYIKDDIHIDKKINAMIDTSHL
jgi:hypothetical protein